MPTKSTVSAAMKKKAKVSKSAAKSRVKTRVNSAAKKVRSKVRSAAKPFKASTTDASESPRQEIPPIVSAADPVVPSAVNAADQVAPSAVSGAAIPLGQSIDLEQEAIRNAADSANIFDPAIGYGLALPGETGVAAVERIKKSRKSKVKKK